MSIYFKNPYGFCCTLDDRPHQNCLCPVSVNCRAACNTDEKCLGYVERDNVISGCSISTTSACPSSCTGPYAVGDTGALSSNHFECLDLHTTSTSYGCWIKHGGMFFLVGNTTLLVIKYIHIL